MVVIGICGGVASGKSLVARELERLGAVIVDADRLGHETLENPEVKEAIRHRWGASVFNADGQVDRPAVAAIVFGPPPDGPTELRFLEQVTHPLIGRKLRERMQQLEQQQVPAVVLDAPVMFRAGWDKHCDYILFVDASRQERLNRARQRGWTESQLQAREAAQESLEWKQQRATHVIDNSGTPAQTAFQIQRFWRTLNQDIPT